MPSVRLILTLFGVLLCSVLQMAESTRISPTVEEYFDIKSNLTTVTWAHAVNSLTALNASLADPSIMMFEADVILGILNTSTNSDKIPIMGHPPASESDLSLEQFLDAVLNEQNKTKRGIKLDFKTIDVFNASQEILAKLRPSMTFPVWINADILSGPVNATGTPVDAAQFLAGARKTFPESTLSIGWTTRYGTDFNITEASYSLDQVDDMLNAVKNNNVTQSITYPVRAGIAAQSMVAMKALISDTPNGTLTIWSSAGDTVDTDKLSQLILEIGVDKVYIDVPDVVWAGLHISSGTNSGIKMGVLAFVSMVAAFAITRLL